MTQHILEGEEYEFEIIAFQTSSLRIPYFSIPLACVCQQYCKISDIPVNDIVSLYNHKMIYTQLSFNQEKENRQIQKTL